MAERNYSEDELLRMARLIMGNQNDPHKNMLLEHYEETLAPDQMALVLLELEIMKEERFSGGKLTKAQSEKFMNYVLDETWLSKNAKIVKFTNMFIELKDED